MQQLTIEHEISRRLAEEGMARTLMAEPQSWLEAATEALARFCALPEWSTFKTEDFRAWWLSSGGLNPHDSHCWGALTNRACKAGIIEFTGRYAPSASPKTHGHEVKVWTAA